MPGSSGIVYSGFVSETVSQAGLELAKEARLASRGGGGGGEQEICLSLPPWY